MFSACILLCSLASFDDSKGLELLTEKGLKGGSGFYALVEEAQLSKGIASMRPLKTSLDKAQKEYNLVQKGKQLTEERAAVIRQRLPQLQRQLNDAARNNQLYNRIVGEINTLQDELQEFERSRTDNGTNKAEKTKLSAARDAYMERLAALRELADSITKKYETLAADEAVKKAIAAANEDSGKDYVLGPSKSFKNLLKSLETLEKAIQKDSTTLVREGDTFRIDVVFNGKYTKSMVFDTGASSISLPYETAIEIGLKPEEAKEVVRVSIADGSVVEGKRMKIDSVRVGKFSVEHVDCIVMPREMTSAPALLGGTFLNNFNYKIDPATGKLDMWKTGEEPPSKTAKNKTPPKKPKKKSDDQSP